MLTIRTRQLDAMERERREQFDRRLAERVVADYPVHAARLGPRVWPVVAAGMVATARAYGCQAAWSVTAFVAIACRFGPAFHRHPAVHAALSDARFAPDERIARLPYTVPESAWLEAAAAAPEWAAAAQA